VLTNPLGSTTYVWNNEILPVIGALDVNFGSLNGGTRVVLTGYGFTGVTSVAVGPTSTTNFIITNDSQLMVIAPAQSDLLDPSQVVRLTNPVGTSSAATGQLATTFNYYTSITDISPADGTLVGGTAVTLTLNALYVSATSLTVLFGETAATSVVPTFGSSLLAQPSTITCSSPAGSGTVQVKLVTVLPTGQTLTSEPIVFTYGQVPVIQYLTSCDGNPGDVLDILGYGFSASTISAINFGTGTGSLVTDFEIVNDSKIKVVVPAGPPDLSTNDYTALVTATNAYGTSVQPATGAPITFRYLPPPTPTISSFSPTSGQYSSPTSVTIQGTNLSAVTSIILGNGISVTTGITATSTTVVFDVPPETVGASSFTIGVVTPTGTATSSGTFSYD